jgi:hypothetical protein
VLIGCAGYSIKKDGTGDGYDVFRPEPYLLVIYPSSTGTAPAPINQKPGPQPANPPAGGAAAPASDAPTPTASIIWLPNYGERYRIDTHNFLAKADFTFTITNGWMLSEISDKSDNSAAVTGLLDIVKAAAGVTSAAAKGGGKGGGPGEETFSLYRIVFDASGHAVGLQHLKELQAAELPQSPGQYTSPYGRP